MSKRALRRSHFWILVFDIHLTFELWHLKLIIQYFYWHPPFRGHMKATSFERGFFTVVFGFLTQLFHTIPNRQLIGFVDIEKGFQLGVKFFDLIFIQVFDVNFREKTDDLILL